MIKEGERMNNFHIMMIEQMKIRMAELEKTKNEICEKLNRQYKNVFTELRIFEEKTLIFQTLIANKGEEGTSSQNEPSVSEEECKIQKELTNDSLSLIDKIENLNFYLQDNFAVSENVPSELIQREDFKNEERISQNVFPQPMIPQISSNNIISQSQKPNLISRAVEFVPSSSVKVKEDRKFGEKVPDLLHKMRKSFYKFNDYQDILYNPLYDRVYASFKSNKGWKDISRNLFSYVKKHELKIGDKCHMRTYVKHYIRLKYLHSLKFDYLSDDGAFTSHVNEKNPYEKDQWVKIKIIPYDVKEYLSKADKRLKNYFTKYFAKRVGRCFYYFGCLRTKIGIRTYFYSQAEGLKTVAFFSIKVFTQFQDAMKLFDNRVIDHNMTEEFLEESLKSVEDLEKVRKEFARKVLLKYHRMFLNYKKNKAENKLDGVEDEEENEELFAEVFCEDD